MKNTLHPLKSEFLALAGEAAESFSFNRSIGQLFAFLYMSPQPLSLEEIAIGCTMSKGNASIHLRTLEKWGAVHRSWKPGTRKDYYTANINLKALGIRRLQEGIARRLEQIHQKLKAFKETSSFHDYMAQSEGPYWKKRLEDIESLMQQVEAGLALFPKQSQLQRFLI